MLILYSVKVAFSFFNILTLEDATKYPTADDWNESRLLLMFVCIYIPVCTVVAFVKLNSTTNLPFFVAVYSLFVVDTVVPLLYFPHGKSFAVGKLNVDLLKPIVNKDKFVLIRI